MILSKAGKLTLLAGLLCLLLMGFTGTSYGQVGRSIKWDVFPSPTEVITTGRSEVLGSISFYVQFGVGTVVTGNALGGPTQIGITYGQGVQIDSTYGVRVYAPKFATAGGIGVVLQNLNIIPTPTRCSGFLTLNIPPNVTLVDGDVIRVDGVRGRIDMSDGRNAGTNLTAQMQSINDPSANMFFPETVRVATSSGHGGDECRVGCRDPVLAALWQGRECHTHQLHRNHGRLCPCFCGQGFQRYRCGSYGSSG
jgi:hypothetical protein